MGSSAFPDELVREIAVLTPYLVGVIYSLMAIGSMLRPRWLPEKSFPPYAYLPGRQPHPVRDPAGHSEAGPLIGQPDCLVAEGLRGELAPAGRRGEGDHCVGVRVVDVRRRDECVQERLDRRAWLVGLERAAPQVLDHRRVLHRLARAKRLDLVQPQRGEATPRDRREVGA